MDFDYSVIEDKERHAQMDLSEELLSVVGTPYREMLSSLADVQGYMPFLTWLCPRVQQNLDWRAEVKGLYEINKPGHPIKDICGPRDGEPEALFLMPDRVSTGLVECRLIRYHPDANHKKSACENTCKNLFSKVQRFLSTGDFLVVVCNSFNSPPTPIDAKEVMQALKSNVMTDTLHETRFGLYGLFHYQPSIDQLEMAIGEQGLMMVISAGGYIVATANSDLSSRVLRALSEKQRQHKEKYRDVFKVFYFMVDCPPPSLSRLDHNMVRKRLCADELLVCCSVGAQGGIDVEKKIILSASKIPGLDFSNPMFTEVAIT